LSSGKSISEGVIMMGKIVRPRAAQFGFFGIKNVRYFPRQPDDFQVRQSAVFPIAHANGWRPLLRIPNVRQANRALLALHDLREKLHSETERRNG